MKVQVAKWGNSTAVRLPKAFVEQLKLEPGMTVDMSVEGDVLKLERRQPETAGFPRPHPLTLEWIVAEMRRLGPDQEPDTEDWGADRGAEVLNDEHAV